MPFVLGAKGTKAAWEASENKDINTFKAHQHTWAVVGWVWAGISILIVIPILFLMVIGSYNGIQQAAKDAQNQSNSNYSNSSFSQ